ncbi:MAG: energy-coupling factor ABC transporter permease [Pseudomonadota bacterium]
MHIEPGLVDGAKMGLAVATAAGATAYGAKLAVEDIARSGPVGFAVRTGLATAGTLTFFELLPHFSAGVSEVHFIFGTTLFLILGAAPAAFGLALGLLVQGLVFAPSDMPMYLVNLTTLLVPLFAVTAVARQVVPADTAYVDLSYAQVLKLSAAYQGGVIAWVAFWVFYGQGVGADTAASVWSFGAAYLLVVLVEPVVDLAVLAAAKARRGSGRSPLVTPRLYQPA